MTEVVLRSELRQMYLDPPTASAIRAYVPEAHASARCERALAGGRRTDPSEDRTLLSGSFPFCETCTTEDPQLATVRRQPDGSWKQQVDV